MVALVAFIGVLALVGVARGEERGLAGVPFPETPEVYLSPLSVAGTVRQGNGGSFSHQGRDRYAWDFMLPPGTPVVAARAGVVRSVRQKSAVGGSSRTFGPHGNRIVVDHLDGTGAVYMHLMHDGARVRTGEYVIRGEILGRSGDTGWSTDPHLHYAVVKIPSNETIPSRFEGFKPNDGVPRKGQALKPAPAPSIKQATLDLYKQAWRGAEMALRLEQTALAWRFLTSLRARKRVAGYYYDRVLSARAAELRAITILELRSLIEIRQPTPAQAQAAAEMQMLLVKADDEEIRELRDRVADARSTWPSATKKVWRRDASGLESWVRGLEAECAGDLAEARKTYAKALSSSRGPLRASAEAALRRLTSQWGKAIDARLKRRAIEVKIVEKPHHKRFLEADLKALRSEARRLRKLHALSWREEADRAADACARREAQQRRLLRLLDAR